MELRIAVVDDMSEDRDTISGHIDRYFGERSERYSISCFDSAEKFLRAYGRGFFGIVFLDICMDGMNGLELSERLRAGDSDIQLIFMSTSKEYVFRVFAAEPKGYLCKPFSYENVAEVMDRTMKHLTAVTKKLTVKLPRMEIALPLNEITYITANNHITEIGTVRGQIYKSTMLFRDFENTLSGEREFVTINRGIIVNMDHAVSVKELNMILEDGTVFPIRQRDRKDISARFTKYAAEKVRRRLFL